MPIRVPRLVMHGHAWPYMATGLLSNKARHSRRLSRVLVKPRLSYTPIHCLRPRAPRSMFACTLVHAHSLPIIVPKAVRVCWILLAVRAPTSGLCRASIISRRACYLLFPFAPDSSLDPLCHAHRPPRMELPFDRAPQTPFKLGLLASQPKVAVAESHISIGISPSTVTGARKHIFNVVLTLSRAFPWLPTALPSTFQLSMSVSLSSEPALSTWYPEAILAHQQVLVFGPVAKILGRCVASAGLLPPLHDFVLLAGSKAESGLSVLSLFTNHLSPRILPSILLSSLVF
ncbi:hypothetical protein C8R45DRAFT_1106190 [Mycena sanguinolenta]|nr:hypothetical protein C8R45DRAFT_1106190 [Mycena sanguinolenta]